MGVTDKGLKGFDPKTQLDAAKSCLDRIKHSSIFYSTTWQPESCTWSGKWEWFFQLARENMRGNFSNGLGRQKRNEFSNGRAGRQKKEDE